MGNIVSPSDKSVFTFRRSISWGGKKQKVKDRTQAMQKVTVQSTFGLVWFGLGLQCVFEISAAQNIKRTVVAAFVR